MRGQGDGNTESKDLAAGIALVFIEDARERPLFELTQAAHHTAGAMSAFGAVNQERPAT